MKKLNNSQERLLEFLIEEAKLEERNIKTLGETIDRFKRKSYNVETYYNQYCEVKQQYSKG